MMMIYTAYMSTSTRLSHLKHTRFTVKTRRLMEVYKIRQKRKTKRDSPHNLPIIDELIQFKQKDNQCSYSLALKNVIFNIKIIFIPS